jgi:hypothetical protein
MQHESKQDEATTQLSGRTTLHARRHHRHDDTRFWAAACVFPARLDWLAGVQRDRQLYWRSTVVALAAALGGRHTPSVRLPYLHMPCNTPWATSHSSCVYHYCSMAACWAGEVGRGAQLPGSVQPANGLRLTCRRATRASQSTSMAPKLGAPVNAQRPPGRRPTKSSAYDPGHARLPAPSAVESDKPLAMTCNKQCMLSTWPHSGNKRRAVRAAQQHPIRHGSFLGVKDIARVQNCQRQTVGQAFRKGILRATCLPDKLVRASALIEAIPSMACPFQAANQQQKAYIMELYDCKCTSKFTNQSQAIPKAYLPTAKRA